jgi:hypothetical protein
VLQDKAPKKTFWMLQLPKFKVLRHKKNKFSNSFFWKTKPINVEWKQKQFKWSSLFYFMVSKWNVLIYNDKRRRRRGESSN